MLTPARLPMATLTKVLRARTAVGPRRGFGFTGTVIDDMDGNLHADDAWDAGGMGCGELVFLLAMRMRAMKPGAVLKLTATDLGAPHDIPAWCRMTGHPLLRAEHPHYFIRRKES